MTVLRQDLLELGIEALTALANAGFVKRAQKDIAEGRLPRIATGEDGSVSAHYEDGHCATLAAARSLREALCTCPATGLCRHRVTLVLAYQHWAAALASAQTVEEPAAAPAESPWTPGEFDDAALAAALAPGVLEQAARSAAARPVIRLQAWRSEAPAPTAHLPLCSVRFFSRRSLSHARCDCRLGGGCEHVVLAVWAFRQAAGLADATVELAPRHAGAARASAFGAAEEQVQHDAAQLLRRLWLDGSSQELLPLEADFAVLRERLSGLGWRWVLECLEELHALLQDQAARSSRFDPQRLVAVMAELPARLAAARSAAQQQTPRVPAAQILGVGVRGEVALEHLKLVSLGLQCWSDARQDGARILFADPDTLSVTALERSWPRGEEGSVTPVLSRRVAGQSLRQLASAQVVTRGARRRANGVVDIAAQARRTQLLPLSARSWDCLGAPLRQPGGAALARHLAQALPDFVQPRQAAAQLHVLPVAQVQAWGWNAAEQTLYATLVCAEPGVEAEAADQVELVLVHTPVAAAAVDVLALALSDADDPPRYVAGLAQLREGRLRLEPLALLTSSRALVLQAAGAPAQRLDRPAGQPDSRGLQAVLEQVHAALLLCARQGWRHQPAAALQRLRDQAALLSGHGLDRSAGLLRQVLDAWHARHSDALTHQLTALVLLLQGLLHGAMPAVSPVPAPRL